MPRGVDLNLDKFNLSASAEPGTWAGTIEAPEGAENLTMDCQAFWSNIDDAKSSIFSDEDRSLLAKVFDAKLSDRRADGEAFLPPPTGLTYMHRLKTLVKEEDLMRQRRKELFFSNDFVMDKGGPLFPASWTSPIALENAAQGCMKVLPRANIKASEATLKEVLDSTTPVFDKCIEDGTRFLIYRVGSLEIRATQDHADADRVVGAIFTVAADLTDVEELQVCEEEKIVKVTEYVERSSLGSLCCKFYVLFQTEKENVIVVEQLADGSVAWRENPENIGARNSLARVMRSSDCSVLVRDVRAKTPVCAGRVSASKCKRFAQVAYQNAVQA